MNLKILPYQALTGFLLLLSFISLAQNHSRGESLVIYPNDQSHQSIKQVTFEFDRPVTYLGGVPTQEQIKYIEIVKGDGKHDKKWLPQCQWRFVDVKRLACELRGEPLLPASIYHVRVNEGFAGLDGWTLPQEVKTEIKTPWPKKVFRDESYSRLVERWWPSMDLVLSWSDNQWLQEYLRAPMQLKLPSGKTRLVKTYIDEQSQHQPLKVKVDGDDLPEDGLYQLVIAPGSDFAFADYRNDEPIVLYEHGFYRDFRFLGARCYSYEQDFDAEPKPAWTEPGQLDGLANCRPELVELSFSWFIFQEHEAFAPLLRGLPKGQVVYSGFEQGRFIYRLSLTAEREYDWDFSHFEDRQVRKLQGQTRFKFTTTKSWPQWQFSHTNRRLTPYDLSYPILGATAVPALKGEVGVIDSLDKLQQWLNEGTLQTQAYDWPMEYQDGHDGYLQIFDFKKFIASGSGLLWLDFITDGVAEKHQQQASNLVNVAGFNLEVFVADDWLFQASSWQTGLPLAGANIHLVCPDESFSTYLGKTNQNGVLLLNEVVANRKCWLWAQLGSTVVARNIESWQDNKQQGIRAWPAQPVYEPGEVIDFGLVGKQRSSNGLKAINNSKGWGDKQLYFGRLHNGQVDDVLVEFPNWSEFGLASLKIKTDQQWPVGSYGLKLYNKDNRHNVNVLGVVELEYFQPPEYEVTFNGSQIIAYAGSFDWRVSAKRLNGVALDGAKVSVSYSGNKVNGTDFWPVGYNWLSDGKSERSAFELPTFNGKLPQNGELEGQSAVIKQPFPLMRINATAIITAKDGEIQQHSAHGFYFNQQRFVGVKFNREQRAIELVMIDKEGNFVEQDNVTVTLSRMDRGKALDKQTCEVTQLPASCPLNGLEKQVNIAVDVAGEFSNKGNVFVYYPTINESSEPLAWAQRVKMAASSDKQVELVLKAKVSGKALIVVSGDQIQSYFYHDVVAGDNQIMLDITAPMMPQVKVETVMTRADADLTDDAKLVGYRTLTAEMHLGVKAPQSLELAVKVPDKRFQSGEQIKVNLQSNQGVDSQSWLVNEALWQLLRVDEQAFDLHKLLQLDKANGYSRFWAGAQHLSYLTSYGFGVERIAVSGSRQNAVSQRRSSRSKMTENYAAGDSSAASSRSSDSLSGEFVESLWFSPKSLKNQQADQLEFNLPKVPGRFKLLTVAVNDSQFALDVQTITTHLPEEYFVDGPKQMFESDKGQLLLTAINRQEQALNQRLDLRLNGKHWRYLQVKGRGNSQKVLSIDLPTMTVGRNKISIWHESLGQVAEHFVEVKAANVTVQQQFLAGEQVGVKLQLPEVFLPDSLSFSARSISALAPSWDTQLQYVRDYPYQCWEQSVSRAVSYAYSPIAAQQWPEGKAYFQRLLHGAQQFSQYGGFSFFASFEQDDFLTAYSYLANSWLKQKDLHMAVDDQLFIQQVTGILNDVNGLAVNRSMALLALTVAGELELSELLSHRQQIGIVSGFAQVLQLLALRHSGAAEQLITQATNELLRTGYQDAGVSILSDNAGRCLALMALGDHPRADVLTEQVLTEQWDKGVFGQTFAASVCSVALKDRIGNNSQPLALNFAQHGDIAVLDLPQGERQRLLMDYLQPVAQQQAFSSGINIKQQYLIKTADGKWRPMSKRHKLRVGDVVKAVVTVDSPMARQHVVIDAPVAGAFEVDNAKFAHGITGGHGVAPSRHGVSINPIPPIRPMLERQISLDRVLFFPTWLGAGKTEFSYLLKVRNSGEYLSAGAKVALMYQQDVAAQVEAKRFKVKGY